MNKELENDLDRIIKIFHDLTPIDNQDAKREIQLICNRIARSDGYFSEKISSIEELAEIYFSTKKHQTYPSGVEGIKHQVRVDVRNLKQRLRVLNSQDNL